METHSNGYRYKNYYKWEVQKNRPYNYERDGLLNRIVSRYIYNTTNDILKSVNEIYETVLIRTMKYIDKLKNYRNYNYYNR